MPISIPSVCIVLFTLLCTLSVRAQKFYQCEEDETPDLKVWAAEKPKNADFNAYFVYDASELKGIGTVLQVPTREEADFALQFVDNKKEADFSLWIVESAEEAGWKNKKKEHLFDKFLNKQ